MLNALNYLNKKRLIIHNDINLENIVISLKGKFQLSDFGAIKKIKSIEDSFKDLYRNGTQFYFSIYQYNYYTSVLYDWNCILMCLLQIMGIKIDHEIKSKKDNVHTVFIEGYNCNEIITKIYDVMEKINIRIGELFQSENDFKKSLGNLIKFLFYVMNLDRNGKLIPFKFNGKIQISNNNEYLIFLDKLIEILCK